MPDRQINRPSLPFLGFGRQLAVPENCEETQNFLPGVIEKALPVSPKKTSPVWSTFPQMLNGKIFFLFRPLHTFPATLNNGMV
jgi:hypothetical protein